MSYRIRKQIIFIGENKAADQLCCNCTADQPLCFRCTDSTILFLLKSEISSFTPASVTVQAGLCQTWLESKLLVFSRTGSSQNGNLSYVFKMSSRFAASKTTFGLIIIFAGLRCIFVCFVMMRTKFCIVLYCINLNKKSKTLHLIWISFHTLCKRRVIKQILTNVFKD